MSADHLAGEFAGAQFPIYIANNLRCQQITWPANSPAPAGQDVAYLLDKCQQITWPANSPARIEGSTDTTTFVSADHLAGEFAGGPALEIER